MTTINNMRAEITTTDCEAVQGIARAPRQADTEKLPWHPPTVETLPVSMTAGGGKFNSPIETVVFGS